MRIGLQSIIWGANCRNLAAMLDIVSRLNFEGIELAQPLTRLGAPTDVLTTFRSTSVSFAGTRALAVGDILRYSELLRPGYVYSDGLDTELMQIRDCLPKAVRTAIHPNFYKPVATSFDFDRLHTTDPLWLVFDVAHA